LKSDFWEHDLTTEISNTLKGFSGADNIHLSGDNVKLTPGGILITDLVYSLGENFLGDGPEGDLMQNLDVLAPLGRRLGIRGNY
jgi:hypothetical protein